ncbi:interleukin-17F-like [Engraulis encrasicolus]|uniref:interleukin-17F-like n=1 Tax=Engraulis encrasicolus TaxID=184585 RepID=UPI002FD38639
MMKIQTWSSTLHRAPPHAAHQTLAIQNRSLAPWENIVSEDPRRLPRRISEARCLTKGCVGLSGGHHEKEREEDLAWRSVPIQVEMMVLRLRRGQGRRSREYQLSSQVITVGCTCVRGRVVRHD